MIVATFCHGTVQLGRQVGYLIRFKDMPEPSTTFLKYMTDGILLHEAMNDPDLYHYSTIILDETHEQTLATDILLGLLKSLANRRSDLKIIIMSTTFYALVFQQYFGTNDGPAAALLEIPEHAHHIEVFYLREEIKNACRRIKLDADQCCQP